MYSKGLFARQVFSHRFCMNQPRFHILLFLMGIRALAHMLLPFLFVDFTSAFQKISVMSFIGAVSMKKPHSETRTGIRSF